MNESLYQADPDPEAAEASAPPSDAAEQRSPGEILRAARLAHDYSYGDLGAQTKLAPKTLRALEDDDFAALPQPVFTRGYYRQCAKVLAIDAERLLAAYTARAGEAGTPRPDSGPAVGVLAPDVGAGRRRSRRPAVLLAVGLAVIAAAVLLASSLRTPASRSADGDGHTVRLAPDRPAGDAASTAGAPGAGGGPPAAGAKPKSQPTPTPAGGDRPIASGGAPRIVGDRHKATSPPAQPAGRHQVRPVPGAKMPAPAGAVGAADDAKPRVPANRLALSLSKRSWVRVTDANGDRLLSGIYPAGTRRQFTGAPPYKVVVGVASGVDMTIGGHKIDVGAHIADNGVARLRVAARGSG